MALDLVEELKGLVASLDEASVGYALCGGLAVAVHGAPRATADIDLLVPEEDVPRAVEAAKRSGFRFAAIPMRFSSGITVHRVSRIRDAELLTLDVIVADDALRGVYDGRERHTLDGSPLWVVSRDGLIAMKALAGRPQDVADIVRLQEQDG